MDHLPLIRFALALLLTWCLPAHAIDTMPATGQQVQGWQGAFPGGTSCQSTDKILAGRCSLMAQHNVSSADLVGCVDSGPASVTCTYAPNNNPLQTGVSQVMVTVEGCGANSTQSGNTCTCGIGFKNVNGTCTPYTCETKALGASVYGPYSTSSSWNTGATNGIKQACDTSGAQRGCVLEQELQMASAGADGWYVTVVERQTGKACNGTGTGGDPAGTDVPDDATQGAPPTCKPNEYPGTVNGQTVCIPATTTKSNANTQTTTNPDGTKTTVKTETSCTGGACTTKETTTTQDTGGNTTSTSTKESTQLQGSYCATNPGDPICTGTSSGGDSDGGEEGGPFCEENPTSPMCQQSAWGGSCSAFTCEGDAVQCAMAKEQHARNCQLFDTPNQSSEIGQAAATQQGRPADHPASSASSVSLGGPGGGFDQTDILGGGACPTGPTMTMMGQSVTLSFTRVCNAAGWLGNLLVGLTALACLGIVFKGN